MQVNGSSEGIDQTTSGTYEKPRRSGHPAEMILIAHEMQDLLI